MLRCELISRLKIDSDSPEGIESRSHGDNHDLLVRRITIYAVAVDSASTGFALLAVGLFGEAMPPYPRSFCFVPCLAVGFARLIDPFFAPVRVAVGWRWSRCAGGGQLWRCSDRLCPDRG